MGGIRGGKIRTNERGEQIAIVNTGRRDVIDLTSSTTVTLFVNGNVLFLMR